MYSIQYKRYELRYPFIGEFAGLVKQQSLIYVRHHFLLINSDNSQMSSTAFSRRLAGLAGATAEGHESKNQQSNSQNHLTYRTGNALHHFSLLWAIASFYCPGITKHTLDFNQLYMLSE